MIQAKPCLIAPNPQAKGLTRQVAGLDHLGAEISLNVVEERPLTIWLNGQEIVTAMTIGDYPEYLAQGFLSNQGMLTKDEIVEAVDFDASWKPWWYAPIGQPIMRPNSRKRPAPLAVRWALFLATSWRGSRGYVCRQRCCGPLGSIAFRTRSTKCRASISARARSMARCFASATRPWSIWKTWGDTMRWIRWPDGCGRHKPQAPIRFSIPPGA